MALPALATVVDLGDRLGVEALTGVDLWRARAALADASVLVRSEANRTWVDARGELTDVPDAVQTVVLSVARRAYDNPSGFTSETIGAYSYSRGKAIMDGLYLTPSERQVLLRASGHSVVKTARLVGPYVDSNGNTL